MRRLPREAGRLMRKWAVGKLKPSQAEAFHSNPVMKPSSEDAHYETRRRHLLSFVLIRLFADMSDSYFACGSSVFFSSQESGAKHIKKALDGEVEKQPDSLSPPPLQNEEEPSLFEIDDTADLRVPLSKTFGGLSQGESPLFGRNMKSKFSYTEDSQLGVFGRQETSFSEMSPTAPEKQHKWPVRGILHADPVPDSVLDEVVGWLRLAMVSIDLDPACSHSDHQVQDYGGDANGMGEYKKLHFLELFFYQMVIFIKTLPLEGRVDEAVRVLPRSSAGGKVSARHAPQCGDKTRTFTGLHVHHERSPMINPMNITSTFPSGSHRRRRCNSDAHELRHRSHVCGLQYSDVVVPVLEPLHRTPPVFPQEADPPEPTRLNHPCVEAFHNVCCVLPPAFHNIKPDYQKRQIHLLSLSLSTLSFTLSFIQTFS